MNTGKNKNKEQRTKNKERNDTTKNEEPNEEQSMPENVQSTRKRGRTAELLLSSAGAKRRASGEFAKRASPSGARFDLASRAKP